MTIMPHSFILAEDEGFKPPIPVMGIPDFESSAFGHSANLPLTRLISPKHVLRALFFRVQR